MRIAIVDKNADEKTVYSLENAGITVIPTTEIPDLYASVATHADMQIHYLGKNRFICAPETYLHYKKLLPDKITLIKGSQAVGAKYPMDIIYNVAAVGKFVICNSRYTATEILSEYKSTKRTILNVRQGYSKCSTAIVTSSAIITADEGIYKTAKENDVKALKITEGGIELKGMNYGFIGGATGLIAKNVLAVNGNINTHTDKERIKKFCKSCDVELFQLKNGPITDIGSIIVNLDLQV